MCRAYLSDFVVKSSGEHIFTSRANIGACALNLPMIWKKSEGVDFYKDLDYYLEMIRQFLIKRYDYVANQPCSTNPLAFTQGGLYRGVKKETDKIGYDIVESFTASFGITALNELNVLMEGKQLHESDKKVVNEVVDYINEKVKHFKNEDGFLYALYGVPAESLGGTQVQQFKAMFGEIKNVSDREYFSNSFHAHVTADITPFEKQDQEEELFHKINGGHIQYCRIENPKNLGAIKAIIQRGMTKGFYQGINHSIVVCDNCGNRPNKPVDVCTMCGSDKITQLDRTCGYLGYSKSGGGNRFNDSKTVEISERVSM